MPKDDILDRLRAQQMATSVTVLRANWVETAIDASEEIKRLRQRVRDLRNALADHNPDHAELAESDL